MSSLPDNPQRVPNPKVNRAILQEIQKVIDTIPPAYLLPPKKNEIFDSPSQALERLQNYSFAVGFAVVIISDNGLQAIRAADAAAEAEAAEILRQERAEAAKEAETEEAAVRVLSRKTQAGRSTQPTKKVVAAATAAAATSFGSTSLAETARITYSVPQWPQDPSIMASQHDAGIAFSYNHEQQNYRLLELPSTLLELITSPDPPILSLKSTSVTAPNAALTAASNAVLCTDDRTFHLRQVHSSNSVFLLQPSEATTSSDDGSIPIPGVSVVAQCKATLELIPTATSAIPYLKESLPVYRDPLGDGNSKFEFSSTSAAKGKLAILDNAPMSTDEFESGWIEVCAFETRGQARRPLASTLNGIWKSILSAAAVNALKFDDGFPTSSITSLVEEDGYPKSLLVAVLIRLSATGDTLSHDWPNIDRDKCVPWVGAILLESETQRREGTAKSAFVQTWKDQLPEVWREQAHLGLLEGKYLQLSSGAITFNNGVNDKTDVKPATATNAEAPNKGARKWHEKFMNTRR
ncbi:MAG: sister chromatid cohesion Dcc1 [Lasallia pustulata]|uniref:Sister chromatid cohesion Dcc1 n=1 Tax=Lasallia pustulata TaxID=136370 RepID=A0A5M8PFW7_9LECA|nr:MAG: sister chromatid cohesion Dcc1 [Lasallia pustulata]